MTVPALMGLYSGVVLLLLFVVMCSVGSKDDPDSSVGLMLNPVDSVLAEASERAAEEWAGYGESIIIGDARAAVQVQWNPELEHTGQPVAAAVFEAGDKIEVNSTMYRPGTDCLWCALFHEIGHLLGYQHGNGRYGLEVG